MIGTTVVSYVIIARDLYHDRDSNHTHRHVTWLSIQAVREAAQYAPAPVRRTLQPSSSPYTPYACGAQRALRHEYS